MRHTRLTTLVGVLSSVVLLSQSLPAYAQNVQVNGGGESSAQQPAATPAPAPQVQVNNTPAPAPAQPPVVVNNVRSDSGNSMHKPAARLMVGGGTLFGVMYLSTVLGAAIASDICNADSRLGCREASWPIYIPIVGPFIQMGYISGTGANTGRAVLAIDGALQAGGVAMFIAGAALWGAGSAKSGQQQASKIRVVPTGTGMMAFGQF